MPTLADNRFLNPSLLAQVASLELVAKTVVDGFVTGLHRSPDFGISQEFAEYRAYVPGDDLRHVDWNVFARTERAFIKRYRGETNTEVTLLLDASASMTYGSHGVNKLDYARYLAASLAYLTHRQRDACGFIAFHDEVTGVVPVSARPGQLNRLFHAIDRTAAGTRTDFAAPFDHLHHLIKRRGITVLISDFLEEPATIFASLRPLRARGQELILFHVVDPNELRPEFGSSVTLLDLETEATVEATPDALRHEYGERLEQHLAGLKKEAQSAGIDYVLLPSNQPLDAALREYFHLRGRRN